MWQHSLTWWWQCGCHWLVTALQSPGKNQVKNVNFKHEASFLRIKAKNPSLIWLALLKFWTILKCKVLGPIRASSHPSHNIKPFPKIPNGRTSEAKFISLLQRIWFSRKASTINKTNPTLFLLSLWPACNSCFQLFTVGAINVGFLHPFMIWAAGGQEVISEEQETEGLGNSQGLFRGDVRHS